ncbi:BBP7 family outer membrane beta-barrel protein, partial [Klebsiella pneumoniae]
AIQSPTQLWGLEANVLCNVCCDCNYRVNALAGLRYLNLRESLNIVEDTVILPGSSLFPTLARLRTSDSFATSNEFYGGQVGLAGRWFHG